MVARTIATPALIASIGLIAPSKLLMNGGVNQCYAWSTIPSLSSPITNSNTGTLGCRYLQLKGTKSNNVDNKVVENILHPSAHVTVGANSSLIPDNERNKVVMKAVLLGAATAFGGVLPIFPIEIASAAVDAAPSPFMSALVAYGHYFSFFLVTVCLMIERLTIKENMTIDDEKLVAKADIAYGIAGTLMVYTGVLRATEYGKGFDFYSHEPLFWVKMIFVAVWAAASLFNTTIVIQRSIAIQQEKDLPPITEKMTSRMNQILNAQLTAMATIPFVATLMARGVLFNASIPWQAEAALVPLAFAGLGYKYVKEALSFKADKLEQPVSSE